jgi:dihydroxy-acid dehydratase
LRFGEATGRRAVEMATSDAPSAGTLVTAGSVSNAVMVLQALGGSTNAVIHLTAMAGRAGIRVDLDAIDRAGRTTPVLANLKPIGTGFMEDFHHAGALPALLRRLRNSLDLGAVAADGRQLGEVIDAWPAWTDDRVIRPIDNPVAAGEALAVLRGSLARMARS